MADNARYHHSKKVQALIKSFFNMPDTRYINQAYAG
jgi:hypothetical protein